jgi:hypothetical protein
MLSILQRPAGWLKKVEHQAKARFRLHGKNAADIASCWVLILATVLPAALTVVYTHGVCGTAPQNTRTQLQLARCSMV